MSFLQFLISGISLGSIYALIALGYTMVYGIAKMLPIAFVGDYAALFLSFLLVLHLGGCSGDLYDMILLLFVIKGDVLMKDTGPKQTFYVRTGG